MEDKFIDAIKDTFGASVYSIMVIAKNIFEAELSEIEHCVSENLDRVIENLNMLANLAEDGYEDARKILGYIKEFVVCELTEDTYILGKDPSIDQVCAFTGNLIEYLDGADESVKALFLSAIREATLKLGLTVDVSIKDADVRWLFNCALAFQR